MIFEFDLSNIHILNSHPPTIRSRKASTIAVAVAVAVAEAVAVTVAVAIHWFTIVCAYLCGVIHIGL